jgi:hypothetical protein
MKVGWTIARLLYSISPVIPTSDSDPDMLRDWPLSDIAAELKISPDQCELETDMLQRSWFKYLKNLPPPTPAVVESKPTVIDIDQCKNVYSDEPISVEQEALLKKRGFDVSDFKITGRPPAKENQEMHWFTSRLTDLERVFNDPMGKERARRLLINELGIRRIDEKVMRMNPDNKDIDRLMARKQDMEKMLLEQAEDLSKACPYVNAQVSKTTAILAISEMMEGLRNFIANRDNRLRDGIYTASEILVMDRESVQQTSHYRPGWVRFHLEADSGLFDPEFKSKMPIAFCQTLDIAHLLAKKTVNEKLNIKIPNLTGAGPGSEYPDLPALAESVEIDLAEETGKETIEDEQIAVPLISVPLEGDDCKARP